MGSYSSIEVLGSMFYWEETAAEQQPGQQPVAEAPRVANGSPAGLVHTEQVIAKKGSIPVSGRYTNERELEQDYTILDKVLGTGLNGPVVLAEGKADGRKYAVKSFKKSGLSLRNRQELKNEAELYLQLDHPHVAQLSMVCETDQVLHLVMEYMEGGELYDRLAKQKRYTEEEAADAVYQMLLAVAYLHANKIAHRDLKLENFLYERKDKNHLKLIDFGFAKFWDPNTRMSQACGSIHYVAPEVLYQCYTTQADMWSIGIIAYMLLTGSPAFHGPDKEILKKIKVGKPHFSTRFAKLSENAQSFVQKLLVRNPVERLSASLALEHPWIKGRHSANSATIDTGILGCLRSYAEASRFRRAALCMMAWSLSTDEQQELREQFLLLDSQKRGSITLKQLKLMLEENFNVGGEEAERLFSMIDSDNSQEIEYSEFLAAAMVGRVNAHEDVLRRTFARFDRDGGGLISADELRTVLGDHFEGTDIEDLIKEVDTSGDGQIDYDEFIAYFQRSEPLAEEQEPCKSPSVATSGDDQLDSQRQRRSFQRRRTAQLSAIIDQLLSSSDMRADAEATAPKKTQPKLERRSQTMPLRLPVLLGTPGVRAEEKLREAM